MPHYRVRFGSTQCGKIPAPVYIPRVFAVGCCGIATVHGARQFELRAGSSLLRISSPHSMTDGARLAGENEPQEVDGEGHCRRLRVVT